MHMACEICGLVTRILANKFVALAILFGVGVYLLIVPGLTNQLGANPIERLLHVSGEIAIWTWGAVLTLTPLRVLFPRSAIVNALNRHRHVNLNDVAGLPLAMQPGVAVQSFDVRNGLAVDGDGERAGRRHGHCVETIVR